MKGPAVEARLPTRAFGEDVPLQTELDRVDLVHVYADHHELCLIEIFVIKNAVAQAVDPLPVGTKKGLRGLALDLGAQSVLATVGFRNPVMIERKQAAAQHQPCQEDRSGQAEHADAACFERCDFIVLGEQAENNQDRYQNGDGREVV